MIRKAQFSPCGKYRYWLSRKWDDRPMAMCVGLNPSTANHETDDATIRILNNVLPWLGYGGFYMLNLYAFIASKPEKLFAGPDPRGTFNDHWLSYIAESCKDVIFCWGSFKNIEHRATQVSKDFPNALCFGKNANGSPWHPRALHYKAIKNHEVKLLPF